MAIVPRCLLPGSLKDHELEKALVAARHLCGSPAVLGPVVFPNAGPDSNPLELER